MRSVLDSYDIGNADDGSSPASSAARMLAWHTRVRRAEIRKFARGAAASVHTACRQEPLGHERQSGEGKPEHQQCMLVKREAVRSRVGLPDVHAVQPWVCH